MSKQRFASQVDVNNNLSKPVTQHYLPKKTKFAFAKPDHVIASSSSWNSSKNMPRFSSNDMEVNSRANIQSHKTRNSNKPVDQKSHTQKPGRPIFTGHRWIPTGKLFDSCTSKVDSEPPHGSNVDIPNIHECKQTLDSMAAEKADISETIVKVDSQMMIQKNDTMSTEVQQAAKTVTTSNELDLLFGPLFDEYFNGENQVVLKSSAVTTTDASNKRQQPDSTSSTSTLATSVTANGNFDL
ncbi:hypothetical protein Tco_0530595 [Tanacetum coccineum]